MHFVHDRNSCISQVNTLWWSIYISSTKAYLLNWTSLQTPRLAFQILKEFLIFRIHVTFVSLGMKANDTTKGKLQISFFFKNQLTLGLKVSSYFCYHHSSTNIWIALLTSLPEIKQLQFLKTKLWNTICKWYLLSELSLLLLESSSVLPYCCYICLPSCTLPYEVHKNKEKVTAYLEGTVTGSLELWIKHWIMGYSGNIFITIQSLTLATTHILSITLFGQFTPALYTVCFIYNTAQSRRFCAYCVLVAALWLSSSLPNRNWAW